MKVSQILDAKGHEVATIEPDALVASAVSRLAERGIGAIVISPDGTSVAGIFSERDVVRLVVSGGPPALMRQLSDVMTTPVFCTTPDRSVDDLMDLMTKRRIRHVPVVDDDNGLVGIVSIGDAVKWRLGELEEERQALIGYITLGG